MHWFSTMRLNKMIRMFVVLVAVALWWSCQTCWAEIPGLEGTLLWLMPVLHPHCSQQEWVGLLRGILQFSLVYWTKRVTVWVADPSFEQLPVP
jgi:hypothetical protein